MAHQKTKELAYQQPLATKAAIYLRVSTEDQAQEGYGLDVQRERCKAQAIAKGWEIIHEFTDEGLSGTKDASLRPGLAALLEAAQTRVIDAAIVLSLDRLGRKTSLVLNLVEQLSDTNVALVSCKESLDTSTPQGQFVLTLFAALAQLERDTIIERTTAGRNERGKVDGEKGGRLPMGYIRTSEGLISIDPQAAETVRRIFALKDQGLSLRSIANKLNSSGTPSARANHPRYADSQWYASNVSDVLKNETAYRGGKRGQSEICWDPILKG